MVMQSGPQHRNQPANGSCNTARKPSRAFRADFLFSSS